MALMTFSRAFMMKMTMFCYNTYCGKLRSSALFTGILQRIPGFYVKFQYIFRPGIFEIKPLGFQRGKKTLVYPRQLKIKLFKESEIQKWLGNRQKIQRIKSYRSLDRFSSKMNPSTQTSKRPCYKATQSSLKETHKSRA